MKEWLRILLSGQPHFTIGGKENPYMLRWYVIPRNRQLNIYVHKFLRDDDDRALHDHPWWFISLILKGGYTEIVPSPDGLGNIAVARNWLSLAFHRATHRHRVVLRYRNGIRPVPAWTLVVTGRKHRTWGFWCPKGFVPWHEFVDQNDSGNVGRGCGEA